MGQAFQALSVWQVMGVGLLFFGGIYVLFALGTLALTHWLFPALGWGRPLDTRPLRPGQLRRELKQSATAILIFGTGMIFPWGFLQLGWAHLTPDASATRIALEILALVIWNDVHFWINHRLLHTRWLRRYHGPQHSSVVVTPFSTYSFHPLESIMLGNVILLPMVVHDFSFWSLLSVPLFSLFFNSIGHSNYDFFPTVSSRNWLAASRRHQRHHAHYNGNYGFQFSFMDRLFGTRLPDRPEEARG
jgi:sterol desaturase/sphingolipid hydroxylase (fatty acid hydroxylase superfamily)